MKRRISVLLVLCAVLSLLQCAALGAGQGITLTAGSAQINAGSGAQQVSVPITLSGNPGLLGLQFQVEYSSELTLQQVDTTGSVMKNLTFTQPGDLSVSPVTLVWDGMDRTDNGSGLVATLVFSVPRTNAAVYDIVLMPTSGGCYDFDLEDVPAAAVNGRITVKGSSSGTTPGSSIYAASVISSSGTRTRYATVERALAAASANSTVELAANTRADELVIPHDVSLDLNGCKLTVSTAVFGFGQVKDSTDGRGSLVLGGAFCHLREDNAQLPVYDNSAAGYRFFAYRLVSVGCTADDSKVQFEMRLEFNNAQAYQILSRSAASVTLALDLNWIGSGKTHRLVFGGAALRSYAAACASTAQEPAVMKLTLTGCNKLQRGTIVAVQPKVETPLGAGSSSLKMKYVVC